VLQLADRQEPITGLVAKKIIEAADSVSVIPSDYWGAPAACIGQG
jgi:hypothetical protein